jgi:hypothetical protein
VRPFAGDRFVPAGFVLAGWSIRGISIAQSLNNGLSPIVTLSRSGVNPNMSTWMSHAPGPSCNE